ncbi:phospholipase C type enzyme [Lunasporangiospora selenospora]|uniref:Phospholipase C type enzyme n=1 Tax=Lunasporangiospora selenospora TaxID=979761 RepID=A0A9P6FWC5_9FUNG|nr:phospholipase C type enzyme [Lunasporangiospora selenospora]
MHENQTLSVLTLNCWGLYCSKYREARFATIGAHLSDPTHHYDLVGLQEVWRDEDYQRLCNMTKGTLPYSRHWASGIDGSGLVILSKYPILETSIRRFQLNGDPTGILQGDWFDGKSCVSAVISHPAGEVVLLNTHLHATYDSKITSDRYLGCRVAQAWEVASTIRSTLTHNPLVIALGDFNSAPDSLVAKIVKGYGGLTDAWEQVHPASPESRSGLTPQEGIDRLGITCDSPLNSYSSSAGWPNHWTGTPIGERLDYIFYKASAQLCCTDVQVVLQNKLPLPSGTRKGCCGKLKSSEHVSDHFAVHAQFSIRPPPSSHHLQQQAKKRHLDEQTLEDVESVHFLLSQQLAKVRSKRVWVIWGLVLFLKLLAIFLLVVGYMQWLETWMDARWAWILLSIGVAWLSSWASMFFLYGLVHCSEAISSYTTLIGEAKTALDSCHAHLH